MQEVIFTMQPRKHSVNIDNYRYSLITKFILTILEEEGPCSCNYINYRISDQLFAMFDGQVSYYVDLVKIDLEKQQIIERVPNSKIHKIRIKRKEF